MRTSKNESRIAIRVQPGASRNSLVGWIGGNLKITLTAPAREGAANAACVAYLAELLGVPPSTVSLVTGARSRTKLVRFQGLSQQELNDRLSRPASQ
jgi:uncharacterized protein (TIGR00251 family)